MHDWHGFRLTIGSLQTRSPGLNVDTCAPTLATVPLAVRGAGLTRENAPGRRVLVACSTRAALTRMCKIIAEHHWKLACAKQRQEPQPVSFGATHINWID